MDNHFIPKPETERKLATTLNAEEMKREVFGESHQTFTDNRFRKYTEDEAPEYDIISGAFKYFNPGALFDRDSTYYFPFLENLMVLSHV